MSSAGKSNDRTLNDPKKHGSFAVLAAIYGGGLLWAILLVHAMAEHASWLLIQHFEGTIISSKLTVLDWSLNGNFKENPFSALWLGSIPAIVSGIAIFIVNRINLESSRSISHFCKFLSGDSKFGKQRGFATMRGMLCMGIILVTHFINIAFDFNLLWSWVDWFLVLVGGYLSGSMVINHFFFQSRIDLLPSDYDRKKDFIDVESRTYTQILHTATWLFATTIGVGWIGIIISLDTQILPREILGDPAFGLDMTAWVIAIVVVSIGVYILIQQTMTYLWRLAESLE